MLKLGVVGVGGIASMHVNNIVEGKCPGIQIVAFADRKEQRRTWAHEKVPEAQIFVEGSELIKAKCCEAVLICVPHYQHPELSILALQNGLHVICEKPAGVYTLQVREMIAEADKHPELTFALMYNQRTNCVYRKVKEMIDNGELGKLKRVNWTITDWFRTQAYYDSGDWRATWAGEGGGVLLNQDPHQLDLLQWLVGMPSKIRAFCHVGKWHNIEVEDDVTAYLEFENGATGTFVTTTGDLMGENRLEITGTKGRIICDGSSIYMYRSSIEETEWIETSKAAYERPEIWEGNIETDGINPQHIGVLNTFKDHIEKGTPLVADGREGINGLMISNAMYLSSWTGETVSLPIDEQKFLKLLNERRVTSKHKDSKNVTLTFGNGETTQWTRYKS